MEYMRILIMGIVRLSILLIVGTLSLMHGEAQTPNTQVHFESDNKGVLFPNVTTSIRTGLNPTVEELSLIVYDTDLKKYMFWDGIAWRQVNNDQYVYPEENNILIGERVGQNLDLDASSESGRSNTFVGDLAGLQNTTGHRNTFIGDGAGRENRTGNSNTNLGLFAGGNLNYGGANVVIGDLAGAGTNSPTDSLVNSVIIGSFALINASKAENNVFIGHRSGTDADSISSNTLVGYRTGEKLRGNGNTFIGSSAGISTVAGSSNTFLGRESGFSNVTGFQNTFLGNSSGYQNTSGRFNTFLGDLSGLNNQTGSANTYVGKSSGFGNQGSFNVMIGRSAGGFNTTTIDSSVFIGYQAGSISPESHTLVIETGDQNNPLIKGHFEKNTLEFNAEVTIGKSVKVTPTLEALPTCDMNVEGLLIYDNSTNKLKICTEPTNGNYMWVNLH